MATVSTIVKKIINSRPLLYESITHEIANIANLAAHIQPEIELELGEKVKIPAVVMAIRRYSEKIHAKETKKIPFKFNSEIIMKTGLSDITFVKSPSLLNKLKRIYDLLDYDKGDTLNVIQGNYEITIVVSEKYTKKILQVLKDEKIINVENGLVSLAMSFSKDFLYTPGIISKVTRKLNWENVNIFENISTMTEIIFIVSKRDSVRAFNALQRLIEEN